MKLYLWNHKAKPSNKCFECRVSSFNCTYHTPYIWEFKWSHEYQGFIYKTRKNIYILYFGNKYEPIWIELNVGIIRYSWDSWKKELGAIKLEMDEGTLYFK